MLGPDDRPGYKDVGVVEGYDRWAATYDEQVNPLILLEEPVTLDLIGDVKAQVVADLGCGTGRYCLLMAERGAASVTGVDSSEKMVGVARAKVEAYPQIDLRVCRMDETELPGESFDLVVCALALLGYVVHSSDHYWLWRLLLGPRMPLMRSR